MLSLLKIDSYAYKHVIHAKKRVSGCYFGTRTATATPAITIVAVRIRLYMRKGGHTNLAFDNEI